MFAHGVLVLGLGCLLCCLAAEIVGFGLLVFESPPFAACFVGSASSSPPYSWRVRVAVVSVRGAVLVVLFAWPGLVLCWCVAPLLVGFAALAVAPPIVGNAVLVRAPPATVGCAVSLCGPSQGGACCAGV